MLPQRDIPMTGDVLTSERGEWREERYQVENSL
jgi:hypothetical protein